MSADAEDDKACAGLIPGMIVAMFHDDFPKPTYRACTPDYPPTSQARIVFVHDLRTLTLEPFDHTLAGEPSRGRRYDRVPRYSRDSTTRDRRNTWQLIS